MPTNRSTNNKDAAHPTAKPDDGIVAVKRYYQLLAKRRWLVLSALLLVMGAGSMWIFSQVRYYRATATVYVEQKAPEVLGHRVREVVDMSTQVWRVREYLNSQESIITSKAISEKVARQLKLAQNEGFFHPEGKVPVKCKHTLREAADRLQSLTAAASVRDSMIMQISIYHHDPKMATRLANAVTEAYLGYNVAYKLSSTAVAVKWLADELDGLKTQLETAELSLYSFKKNNNIVSVSLEDSQTLISSQIQTLNRALTAMSMSRMKLDARRKQLVGLRGKDILNVAAEPILANPIFQQLKSQLIAESRKLSALEVRYLKQHPLIREQEAKVESVRAGLKRELDNVYAAVETRYLEIKDNERMLAAALQVAKNEALELNKREVDYKRLKRTQENTANLYQLVLRRMKESGLSGRLRVNNLRLLDKAVAPHSPFRPRVRMLLIALGLLGLLLGVGLALMVEAMDTTIKSQEDFNEVPGGLVCLGQVPRIPGGSPQAGRTSPRPDHDLVVHRAPMSAIAESCRAIRTNLLFASPDHRIGRIVVTSPGPREGKTTTAVNIAIVMAQSGGRILLIDTDMRRPRLHKVFGVPGTEGLTSVLLGDRKVDDMIKTTEVPDLYVLPCGPTPPNPAELCYSDSFKSLFTKLAGQFDLMIFDSPPVMMVTDAVVLSKLVDGVVLVARTGQTVFAPLRDTVQQIRDVGGDILGAVINDMDVERRGYYRYYRYGRYRRYRYGDARGGYYGYGADPEGEAKG